jgi:hypothetical protein
VLDNKNGSQNCGVHTFRKGGIGTQSRNVRENHENPILRLLTSLPGSRGCPRPVTLSLFRSSHLCPYSYRYIGHLMCLVDLTVDQAVAVVHLCLDFAPCAETKDTGESKQGALGSGRRTDHPRLICIAVSGCWWWLRRGCKRQTSRYQKQLPAPLAEGACQELNDAAYCSIYDW